jgi:gliding motility-associated-like protein
MKFLLNIFCLITALTINAQEDTIHFTITKQNSRCNGLNDGSAAVNVVVENPPYYYIWSTGENGQSIDGLAPGDYTVSIVDSSGTDTTVMFTIAEKPCVIAPELMFSPNGDGIGDTWFISNIHYYPDNEILVFNRWGQMVYRSAGNYISWDGRDLSGVAVPDNAYYYIIYPHKGNEEGLLKGNVNILR